MQVIRETVTLEKSPKLFPDLYFEGLTWATLDIETLGLSPTRAPIILVGLAKPGTAEGQVDLTLFFAENIHKPGAEAELLEAVEEALVDVDVAVTYNGHTFDLPYIRKRREVLGLAPPRRRYHLDLYRLVRDHSDIGKFLPNLKQTTVESFAGLWEHRKDEINGAKSISLYYDYLTDPVANADAREAILLHNHDDILQLYRLTDILRKVDMHQAIYKQGFLVRNLGHDLLIKVIDVTKDTFHMEGLQLTNPFDYIDFGDDGLGYRFDGGRFEVTYRILEASGLTLVDATKEEAPPLPEDSLREGYLVVAQGQDINYRNANLLAKALLKQITAIQENHC